MVRVDLEEFEMNELCYIEYPTGKKGWVLWDISMILCAFKYRIYLKLESILY